MKFRTRFRTSSRFWPIVLVILAAVLLVWLGVSYRQVNWAVLDGSTSKTEFVLNDYIHAGMWIAGLGVSVLLLVLATVFPWWSMPQAVPAMASQENRFSSPRQRHKIGFGWFAFWLLMILSAATVVRWPCMSISFWGDESWQFCDFVHGKWKPIVKGGDVQQGVMFKQVSWKQTLLGDQSGNNHWMASMSQRVVLNAWQKATGKECWEFDERVVRTVSLFGGLGSLIALALWFRSMSRDMEGLLASALMSLHPWHVRFSFEARGYGLMLLFFVLMLWAWTNALRFGRKRDWAWLGVSQFLVLYAWKGAVYPLLGLNLVWLGWLTFCKIPRGEHLRSVVLARWLVANCIGAILFLPVAVPSQLQIRHELPSLRGRAKPMNHLWFNNLVSETVSGLSWHDGESDNPHAVSIARQQKKIPVTKTAWMIIALLPLVGLVRSWRRKDYFLTVSCMAVMMSAILAMTHFKYVMRVELLSWYWLYCLPALVCLSVVALQGLIDKIGKHRAGFSPLLASLVILSGFGSFWYPKIRDLQLHPREDYRNAWLFTRGKHEPAGYAGPSNIYTAWLWRHSDLYDPRGSKHVRTAEALRQKAISAHQSRGEFYMIIGDEALCDLLCKDLMALLRRQEYFEKQQIFWGVEPLNALTIYKMIQPPPAEVIDELLFTKVKMQGSASSNNR